MDDQRTNELSDEQIVTAMPGAAGTVRASELQTDRDADGTDGDATDGKDGDAQDADGTDGDATDSTDGDSQDADGTDTPS
jgi:hypothetical protein